MKKITTYIITIVTAIITFYSCQKPLDIKATDSNANVLVVEGFINTADSTKISLSRTVTIGNKTTASPELNAQITLENTTGTVAPLQHLGKGIYATVSLTLDNTKQYRIRIKTSNGKTYLSDLTEAKVTPPIDSVGYNITADGMIIYANTHDDTNKSKYYLYNYEETWRFKTPYLSAYKGNGYAIVSRANNEILNYCFGFEASKNVVLNSTNTLTQDVVYQAPITSIISSSEKISIRYSILLTQTALTKDAYEFWENLRKNTEKLGSIFDAQPSQFFGNIHNVTDGAEPVIGYISAGTKTTKRVFIDKAQLPSSFLTEYPYTCKVDTIRGPDLLFLNLITYPDLILAPIGLTTIRPCADCTIRGRVPQPSFWQ